MPLSLETSAIIEATAPDVRERAGEMLARMEEQLAGSDALPAVRARFIVGGVDHDLIGALIALAVKARGSGARAPRAPDAGDPAAAALPRHREAIDRALVRALGEALRASDGPMVRNAWSAALAVLAEQQTGASR